MSITQTTMIETVDVSEIHMIDSESSDTNEKYPKHSTPIKSKPKGSEKTEGKKKRGLLNSSGRQPSSPNKTKHGSSVSYSQDQSTITSSRAPVQQLFQSSPHDASRSMGTPGPMSKLPSNSHNASRSQKPLSQPLSKSHGESVMSTPVKDKSDTIYSNVQPPSPGQSSLESATIQKQREEIKLLMNELKERDQELNEMVSAHQHQLISWQTDRKKIVILEQKCRKYKNDLTSRSELLERATSRLEDLEKTCSTQLECNKAKLSQLIHDKDSQTSLLISLEDRNKSLNDSLKEASSTVGELAAREQEMVTLLKLKDHEIHDLKQKYGDMYTRFQQLEKRNSECHTRERDAFGQSTHWQEKYHKELCEVEKLKVDVDQRDEVLTQQIAQINEAQQHMIALQEALIVSNEREKSKDELIASLKSKEDRRVSELRSVRELYERQQRELTMLQMNLDTSQMIEQSVHLNYSQQYESSVDPNIPELDVSYDSTTVGQRNVLSFDDRLSRFLNTSLTRDSQFTNGNSNISEKPPVTNQIQEEPSSPGGKLQRLLTESKQLIETLERSSLTASPTQQSSNQKNDTNH